MRQIVAFIAGFCLVVVGGMAASTVATGPSGESGATTEWGVRTVYLDDSYPQDLDVAFQNGINTDSWSTSLWNLNWDSDGKKADQGTGDDPGKDTPVTKPVGDTTPPAIEIVSPTDGQTFTGDKVITYRGTVEPGSKVYGAGYEADVDAEGNWQIKLVLSPGKNTTLFKAIDAAGNITKKTITVNYEGVDSAWKIEQYHAENAENWTKFKVWGTPGTKVTATSNYGSGSGTIGAEGYLKYLWVEFSGNSAGEKFPVTVKDDRGNSKTFNFKLVEASNLEWSIEQAYGQNTENWTKFFITGKAGEKVVAESAYGRTVGTIGSDGHLDYWQVFFNEDTPCDIPVKVTVAYQGQVKGEFWFTWVSK